jgi:hypothetical protein
METGVIKAILESPNGWMAIVIFVLYILFQIFLKYLDQKKAKTKEQIFIKSSKTKDGLIESIERRLKILSNQYSADLSKEAAICVLQNIYFNFSTILIAEIDEYRANKNISVASLIAIIKTRISILNDDKMQELELFLYKGRELITFTSGDIVESDIIVAIISSYADKNGMLAREIRTHIEMNLNKVIKRL